MKKLFNNQWFRTILSTMIGIIAGLYITNAYENQKLVKVKNQALEQVAIEIGNNRDTLQIYHDTLTSLYEASKYLFPQINSDFKLIIHKDSLERFIEQSKRIFAYKKYENHSKDSIKLSGDLELYVTNKLILLDLTQVTWDAYKQANLLGITPFGCLRDLEDLYILQKRVTTLNEEWRNILFKQEFLYKSSTTDSFLALWNALLLKQSVLLQLYKNFQEEEGIENCK